MHTERHALNAPFGEKIAMQGQIVYQLLLHSALLKKQMPLQTVVSLQVNFLKVEHGAVIPLFRSANPAFNKLAALLLHLAEQLRHIWLQVLSWQQLLIRPAFKPLKSF